jgi:hypothetical protein
MRSKRRNKKRRGKGEDKKGELLFYATSTPVLFLKASLNESTFLPVGLGLKGIWNGSMFSF